MNKIYEKWLKYKFYVLFLLATIVALNIGLKLHEKFFGYYITAQFVELGPLYRSMPVYYKGYKIGQTKKINPSEDYKYTLVQIILFPKELKLPENVTAKVKKLDSGKDYIELVYPKAPSGELLKRNGVVEGKTSVDIESFMSAQADSGVLTSMTDDMSKTLKSAEKTSNEIRGFFEDSRAILRDNRANLQNTTASTAQTMENLALMTEYLAELSSKLNSSVSQDQLKNTVSNIDKSSSNLQASTENLKSITVNVDIATRNLDKTMAKIDSTILEAHAIAVNIKKISAGFCDTMGKHFAGLRIFFGKPLKEKTCSQGKCLSSNNSSDK